MVIFTIRRLRGFILVCLALFCALPSPASAQTGQRPSATVARTMGLSELGFAQGLRLDALEHTRQLYFPIPPGTRLTSAALRIAYDEVVPDGAPRNLQITIADRVVLTRALPPRHDHLEIALPVTEDDIVHGFVKVTLAYSGAPAPGCATAPAPDGQLTLLPQTVLALTLVRNSMATVGATLTLLPRAVALGIPDRMLTEAETATAVSTLRLLRAHGHQVDVVPLQTLLSPESSPHWTNWQRGDVVVAAVDDLRGTGIAPISGSTTVHATELTDGPGLVVGSADAARAAAELGSPWQQVRGNPPDRVSFGQLGIVTPPAEDTDRLAWTFPFSMRDLPAGSRPIALDLVLSANDPARLTAIAVFLNGRKLDGPAIRVGHAIRLRAVIPSSATDLDNWIRIVVWRSPRPGVCPTPADNAPPRLLETSALELGHVTAHPADFHALSMRMHNGLTLLVGTLSGDAQRTALAALGSATTQLTSTSVPLQVTQIRDGVMPHLTTPFIAYGNPDLADIASPIRFDQGNIRFTTRDHATLFDSSHPNRTLLAQIVEPAGGPAGIWLYPIGTACGTAPIDVRLDRNNVAFNDIAGDTIAFSTLKRNLVRVQYTRPTSWIQRLPGYRVQLIGAAWFALSVAVLVALMRLRKSRGAHREDQ